jgi:predicted phage tail protein
MVNMLDGSSVRSHTLTGLNEDSRYTITVRAINTMGSAIATVTADTLTSGMFQALSILYIAGTVNVVQYKLGLL